MLKSNLFKIGMSQVMVVLSFVVGYAIFQQGREGKVYLKIEDTSSRVCRYTDNNDNIPIDLQCGDYYGSCNEGEYEFEFEWCSGGGWRGTYTLLSEKAEKASFFSKSENGRSRWYIFEITKRGNSVFKPEVNAIDTILNQEGIEFHLKASYFPDLIVKESKLNRSI